MYINYLLTQTLINNLYNIAGKKAGIIHTNRL